MIVINYRRERSQRELMGQAGFILDRDFKKRERRWEGRDRGFWEILNIK